MAQGVQPGPSQRNHLPIFARVDGGAWQDSPLNEPEPVLVKVRDAKQCVLKKPARWDRCESVLIEIVQKIAKSFHE